MDVHSYPRLWYNMVLMGFDPCKRSKVKCLGGFPSVSSYKGDTTIPIHTISYSTMYAIIEYHKSRNWLLHLVTYFHQPARRTSAPTKQPHTTECCWPILTNWNIESQWGRCIIFTKILTASAVSPVQQNRAGCPPPHFLKPRYQRNVFALRVHRWPQAPDLSGLNLCLPWCGKVPKFEHHLDR